MKIIKINYLKGDKFGAVLECEGCGHMVWNMHGVQLQRFHDTGILELECPGCGRTRREFLKGARPY